MVHFNDKTIKGTQPPWATSATDALDLVQSLLCCGALVSCTMHTCTKHLRADCFSGHMEVVYYSAGEHQVDLEVTNWCGHTCLMISCYTGPCQIAPYLILQGAQVNLCSIKDNVALHDCTKASSLGCPTAAVRVPGSQGMGWLWHDNTSVCLRDGPHQHHGGPQPGAAFWGGDTARDGPRRPIYQPGMCAASTCLLLQLFPGGTPEHQLGSCLAALEFLGATIHG